ncbi:TPA: hypothetical protein QCW42_004114 [Bacillus cereus]|nr:hypothetical protein [Bacillus cereus]
MNFPVGLTSGAKYLLELYTDRNRDKMDISLAELVGKYYDGESAMDYSAVMLGNHVLVGYENKEGKFMAETLDEIVMRMKETG